MKQLLIALTLAGLLAQPSGAFSLSEGFDGGIDPFFFSVTPGMDNTVEVIGGRVVITQDSGVGSGVSLLHPIVGDFTCTVDYELLNWPADNKHSAALGSAQGAVQRVGNSGFGGEVYLTDFAPLGGGLSASIPTTDLTGTLRMRRTGSVVCGDFFDGAVFEEIDCHDAGSVPDIVGLGMGMFSAAGFTPGVQIAFDSFTLDAPGTSVCGDGVMELAEVCDDGNVADDDGCSADCLTAGFCPAMPDLACLDAEKGLLRIDERKVGKEKLKAAIKKLSASTTPSDFGDPVSGTTAYALCIYDGADALVDELIVARAGDPCGSKGKDCWKATKTGLKYKDSDAASDGVQKLATKSGPEKKGKLTAAARNNPKKAQVALPTGLTAALAGAGQATLQVRSSDASCFQAVLTEVKRADADFFQAK